VATTAQTYTEEFIEVAGGKLHLLKGGTGAPVLVLHHDIGQPGWLPFHEQLAGRSAVYAPEQPGYGQSQRADWARHVRDLAAVNQWLIQSLKLERVTLVGLGFGGWIAAEMASLAPAQFARLVLVGAMGIQPRAGEIFDQALVDHIAYSRAAFHDQTRYDALFGELPETDQLEAWEINRETTFRIAWKPYMFNPALPHLLGAVAAPTLIVWGDDDRIVPRECADRYAAALPNARIEIVPNCGHAVDLEQPDTLARLIGDFVGK